MVRALSLSLVCLAVFVGAAEAKPRPKSHRLALAQEAGGKALKAAVRGLAAKPPTLRRVVDAAKCSGLKRVTVGVCVQGKASPASEAVKTQRWQQASRTPGYPVHQDCCAMAIAGKAGLTLIDTPAAGPIRKVLTQTGRPAASSVIAVIPPFV
ncbi:MAG: hypothetical protein R3F60_29515 [bacterium]